MLAALKMTPAELFAKFNPNAMSEVDKEEVCRILTEVSREGDDGEISLMIDEIIRCVCEHCNVDREVLMAGRSADAMLARQVAIFLCRHVGNVNLAEISARFDKTYATLIHAVKLTEKRMTEDLAFKQTVQKIEGKIARMCRSL